MGWEKIGNIKGPKGDTGVPGASIKGDTGATGAAGASITAQPAAATRTLNTAFQISATRPAIASYSIDVTVNALLVTGAQGTVTLQYADNAAMTTNLVTVDGGTNSTGGVLNITNIGTVKLYAVVPAGKYVRIVTTNTTGAPTFSFRQGQETLL